ncbi:hypothetical protein V6V47_18350 [Micromonospora sp. CPCC 205539]|uniref:hypothetical protein n=1 Tax=Micromonospora sp. CPCC 205539 TaxID=3122408 RepID=UPI002FF3BD3C
MSGGVAGPRGRDVGLVWGIVAVFCIAPVFYTWLRSPGATDQAVFGRAASLAVLLIALMLTAVAAVVSVVIWYGARDWSRGRRWGAAGPLLASALAVVVLGVGCLTVAQTSVDLVLGGLLVVGAAAAAMVAGQVVRVRATAARDRLRKRFEQLRKDRS